MMAVASLIQHFSAKKNLLSENFQSIFFVYICKQIRGFAQNKLAIAAETVKNREKP
jgi:hypothetical protein